MCNVHTSARQTNNFNCTECNKYILITSIEIETVFEPIDKRFCSLNTWIKDVWRLLDTNFFIKLDFWIFFYGILSSISCK